MNKFILTDDTLLLKEKGTGEVVVLEDAATGIQKKIAWSLQLAAVGFSIGEYGYIGLGLRKESWLGHVKDLWAYLPAIDTWTKKQNCPSEKSLDGSTAFVMNNKAYVTFGWGGEKIVWAYNPETDDWDQDGEMPGSYRIGAVAFVVGDKALVGTGSTASTFFKDFVEYTPK